MSARREVGQGDELFLEGAEGVATYGRYLREREDLSTPTLRNYLSDLRHFVAWHEGRAEAASFDPADVTTPVITGYRSWMQREARLKPATINRRLVTLDRYFAWAMERGLIARDPAKPVKQIPVVEASPRHLSDREENALLAAVEKYGSLRDRTLLVLALHTGLRAGELVALRREHVERRERSGAVRVYGKRNKYREVPLNSTPASGHISAQQLGEVVARYVRLPKVEDVSPHDLQHRFRYRMAERVSLHRLAQITGHDSLDTTMLYVRGTKADLQAAVEGIAWHCRASLGQESERIVTILAAPHHLFHRFLRFACYDACQSACMGTKPRTAVALRCRNDHRNVFSTLLRRNVPSLPSRESMGQASVRFSFNSMGGQPDVRLRAVGTDRRGAIDTPHGVNGNRPSGGRAPLCGHVWLGRYSPRAHISSRTIWLGRR